MNVRDFLAVDNVLVDVRASPKAQMLALLAQHVSPKVGIEAERLCAALLQREELGSTGMGGGIALPHARFASVTDPVGVLARLKAAMPFDAIDDAPVDVIFLLVLPTETSGKSLNALACVARRLRDPSTLAALRRARTAAELYTAFVDRSIVPTPGD